MRNIYPLSKEDISSLLQESFVFNYGLFSLKQLANENSSLKSITNKFYKIEDEMTESSIRTLSLKKEMLAKYNIDTNAKEITFTDNAIVANS